MDNDGMQILFAAVVSKFGPFDLTQEDIESVITGVKVWMDDKNELLHVESWDQSEAQDQAPE
jgi:hypothetical protein